MTPHNPPPVGPAAGLQWDTKPSPQEQAETPDESPADQAEMDRDPADRLVEA